NTLNAYRPLAQRGPASVAVMPASSLTTELPLQTIAWQQLATLALARRGALRRPLGRLGLTLSAVSWAGLWNLHREAQRSADVLEAALVDELGAGYRSPIVALRVPPVDVPLRRSQVAIVRR